VVSDQRNPAAVKIALSTGCGQSPDGFVRFYLQANKQCRCRSDWNSSGSAARLISSGSGMSASRIAAAVRASIVLTDG